jgi:hypothetical protein
MPILDYERFPKPPGENPYRIKGTAYRGHMAYVAEHLPGGVPAMLDCVADPALRAFYQQTFLAASFYDIYPLVAGGHVCARMASTTFEGFVRVRTRYQAERDVAGVYKMLLKLTSPESLALRLPRLVGQYLDFGKADAHLVKPGHVVGTQAGTPRTIARWFSIVHEEYFSTLLPMAGARNVRFRAEPLPRVDSVENGVELVTLRGDVFWE